MKVILQLIVSRDGYIAGVGDDISWISEKTRAQYTRTIRGMGNCIVGRRAWQVLNRIKIPDFRLQTPESRHCEELEATKQSMNNDNILGSEIFTVILSKHNYTSQPNRHFTHAKPKNILKLLDEKGRSSTVICGGLETAKLFLDAGVVDMVHLYHEDVDVGEGVKFEEKLLDGWECVYNSESQKLFSRIRSD